MVSNLALMIAGGIVLSIFGLISALNASIEDRSARLGQGALCLGDWDGGLILDHVARWFDYFRYSAGFFDRCGGFGEIVFTACSCGHSRLKAKLYRGTGQKWHAESRAHVLK
jgi:hypothetical protein